MLDTLHFQIQKKVSYFQNGRFMHLSWNFITNSTNQSGSIQRKEKQRKSRYLQFTKNKLRKYLIVVILNSSYNIILLFENVYTNCIIFLLRIVKQI